MVHKAKITGACSSAGAELACSCALKFLLFKQPETIGPIREKYKNMKAGKLKMLAILISAGCAFISSARAGTFRSITVDGNTSDWAGIAPAYTDEDGVNNPGGVDFQDVYLANDANYLYIRFTLKQPADPITPGNTYIWIDDDNNNSTGFHPFGNLNFGSSLVIIGDQAYQEAGGGFNEGTLANAGVVYGAGAIPGTNFEFKISRHVTGVSGSFSGTPLLTNKTIEVQLGSETGSGDSLPSWANYGTLHYAFASPLGIMVPAYFYPSPGGYWDSLNFAATRVPLVAVMNPNSGPGSSRDSHYVQALANLHQAGGKVMGYVHTSYGQRSLSTVETDINRYLSFYTVDGFFIDEMTNDENTRHLNYYDSLYQYIKAKGTNYSVTGNPGSNTQEDYITRPTADSFMIFEDIGANYISWTTSSWVAKYPAQQFVHLPYAVATATTMSNYVNVALSGNTGWIYITDDALPNPYDTLPSYWTNEVNFIQSLNGGVL